MTELPTIPQSGLAARAAELARTHTPPAIVNHSVRTFLHAVVAGDRLEVTDYDPDELFLACILHDVGTAAAFDGPQRFEVEGADAAAHFLRVEGVGSATISRIWEAIALHTSPGIAERMGVLTRLTRIGVVTDFGRGSLASHELAAEIEQRYPRLDIERTLADAVVRQAIGQPGKAPASTWPGGLLRAHLADPDAPGLNAGF